MATMRDNLVVVLHQPRKLVNIAGAVRAMKNMNVRRLRLVAPGEYDAYDITGIAHRSDDILGGVEVFDTLDAALADITYVVGTTARRRGDFRQTHTPRELAPALVQRALNGPIALLFGPEDNGLTNTELDRCHALVMIPTAPEYASLNLAQAVLLVCYELFLADTPPNAQPEAPAPASGAQLESFFQALEHMLWAVEFLKHERAESTLRTLRSLTHRAEPSTREVGLLVAICREVEHYVARKTGVRPSD